MARKSRGYVPLTYAEAVALVGEERLTRGQEGNTVDNWIARKSVPWDVVGPILAQMQDPQPAIKSKPEWLDPEWQATHAFTAMVEALRRLERIPPRGRGAWRTRIAWEAVLEASKAVRDIAGWGDAQWKMVHDKKLDHWLRPRPARRGEPETLTERLQIELGFSWEED